MRGYIDLGKIEEPRRLAADPAANALKRLSLRPGLWESTS